jgi:hypothetical protein
MEFKLLGPKDQQLVAPSREGGVDVTVSCLSAEGAPRGCRPLRASGQTRELTSPPLRVGATNCRSSGPKIGLRLIFQTAG